MTQKSYIRLPFSALFPILILVSLGALQILNNDAIWALERATPSEIQQLDSTGELQSRIDFVKQIGNHKVDKFLLKKAIIKARRMILESQGKTRAEIDGIAPLMAPPPAWQGMPTTGNVRILAILIEFQDYTHSNTQNTIHSNLFGAGDAARTPYESLDRYYDRASYNQLDLSNGNTLGWYQTSYNRSSVTQNTTGRQNLIKEVLTHYDNQGHDFSQYDNDGNGVIDYFVVIWTGPDNGWGNFWWGYQTSFTDNSYVLDGVTLGKYSWQWESRPVGGTFSPVVVIHETGHALGVPDYYDYAPGMGPNGGLGDIDMMDANCGDHNAFTKWMLEWITPVPVSSGTQVLTLNASGTNQDAVIIWPGITTGDLFSEFYIVQNRHRVGNDNTTCMPGDGMLIFHVDAHLDALGNDFLYDNSFTSRKLLRLMEADGLEEIETGDGRADADDYYKAGATFGTCSMPSSKKYDGSDSGIEISNFSNPGAQMSATFKISLSPAADYTIPDLSINPTSAKPGNQVQVTYTALNQGGNPSMCINMAIYLSGDATIDASDTQLKSWGLPNCNLAACETITQTWAVTIPSGTAPGNYYIGIFADWNNYQAEADENNNTRSVPVTITSDQEGWTSFYSALEIGQENLASLRDFRDNYLMKSVKGKLITFLLYGSSEEVLNILMADPDLFETAKKVLHANLPAIGKILRGEKVPLQHTAEVMSFLDKVAGRSSFTLKILANMVKIELSENQNNNTPFLGFMPGGY